MRISSLREWERDEDEVDEDGEDDVSVEGMEMSSGDWRS